MVSSMENRPNHELSPRKFCVFFLSCARVFSSYLFLEIKFRIQRMDAHFH